MSDTIVEIDFTSVGISDSLNGGHTGALTGSLTIDYSLHPPGTVTAGSLTFAGKALPGIPGNSVTFTTFDLSHNALGYVLTASSGSITLQLQWSPQQPTTLTYGKITAAPSGHIYNFLNPDTLHSTPVCFAAGTLIRTPRGDVPVETLRVGDAVLNAAGVARPVKWLGHRAFPSDPSAHGDQHAPHKHKVVRIASPYKYEVIRIAAHAFGPDRPSHDLVVSPGHSICVDLIGEVLIPAEHLVNGATVARSLLDEVTLWHVELESHDVLIANNLPAESYLAMGNRGYFEEAGATLESFEEGKTKTHADFCLPVAVDGPIPDFVRNRLTERALSLGWTASYDDDLRLVVDGQLRRPLIERDAAVFLFPSDARDVRLVSNTFSPKDFGSGDSRVLGAMLFGFVLSGGHGDTRRIAIDDERLRDGVYEVEGHAPRFCWTDGDLVLDPQLWEGLSGGVSLLVSCNRETVRGWIAPAGAEEARSEARPRLYAIR
jgi:hypothetical protein